jgi:RNA polymerase sigma factor (TIGR02999 family)
VGARERDWENRRHFFAVAARAMRRLLIDHAGGRTTAEQVPIAGLEAWLRGRDDKLDLAVAVDQLLAELEATHQDWCSIVELKFFMGLTDEEAADALGLPLRTMQRKFSDARRWLFERLESRP